MSEEEFRVLEELNNPEEFFGMVATSEDGRPVHITKFGIERVMTRAEALARVQQPVDENDWMSLMNYGTALHVVGDSKKALAVTARAAQLNKNASTLLNLAVVLEAYGRFDESLDLAREAIRRDPTNQFAGLLWAQGMLRQGRWKEAWPAFEWYCWGKIWEPLKEYIPQWEGEPLEGKRILVLQGGGFGDNMMFFRWVGKLKEAGAHVTYACPDTMIPLLTGHPYCDELVPTHEGPETDMLPEVDIWVNKNGEQQYDYFIPIMALPRRFDATVETIPWDGPYIEASKYKRCGLVRSRIQAVKELTQLPMVGFCWKAGEVLDPRRQRSLTREQANKLIAVDNVNWVSLQVMAKDSQGHTSAPLENDGRFMELEIKNWADTARIVADLDLVVTIDTGIMHLAGAMGKPTWVMLSSLSDWKFFLNGDNDPFYPSLRIFRNGQGITGIDKALENVIEALKGLK